MKLLKKNLYTSCFSFLLMTKKLLYFSNVFPLTIYVANIIFNVFACFNRFKRRNSPRRHHFSVFTYDDTIIPLGDNLEKTYKDVHHVFNFCSLLTMSLRRRCTLTRSYVDKHLVGNRLRNVCFGTREHFSNFFFIFHNGYHLMKNIFWPFRRDIFF